MTDDRDQSWQPFDDGSNPEPEGDFSAAPPAGDGTAVPAKGAALLSRLLDRQEKIIDRSVEDLDDVISELKRIAGTSGHHTVESGSDRAAPGAADGDKADTAPVKREESSFPQREVRTTPAVDASAPPLESPPPTAAVSPGASKSAGNVPAQQPASGKVQEAPPKAFEEPPKVQAAAARPAEAAVAPQPQQNDVAPATKAESVSASKATVDAAPAAKAESALASKAAVDAAPAAKAESGSVPKAAAEAAPVEPSAPAPEAAHPGQAAGNGDSSTERTARASRPAAQSEQAEPELVLKAEAPRARTDEPARQEMKNKPVLPGITIEGDRGPVMAKEQLPGGKGPTGVDKGRGGGGGGGGGDGVFHKRLGPVDFSASLKAGLRAVKQNLIVVMIFTVATNILVLAIPVYLFQISDRVLTSRSLDTLVMLTVVIVGAVILQAVFDAVRRFILMRTAVEVAAQLGGPILSAAARASLNSNGREYQTLGDLQQLRSFLVSGTLLAFLDAPIAPLFVLAVFLIHPHLGFIVVATALMLLAITLANQRATAAPFGEANSHQTRANLHVESMSRNSQIINALAMIPEAVVIWGKETAESLKSQVTAQDRNIAFASMSKAVRLLTQVLMLGWGAYLAIEGTVTGGMVIAASIIAGRALGPIEGAIEGWNQVVQSRAAYGRISALLKESPLNFERLKLPRPEGRLDVERLLFVPQGTKRVVLNGVTFSLSPGDSLAIIGNSGAGKTTLGKMLVGSILPTSGNVRLDLMDLRNWDPRQFGESIGYLPQDVQLFPGSIKANIGRMREDATDAEIFEAARLADVHELIASLPHGYETFVAADGAPLSGGQKQRIGLARAFFGSPKMIVLDEPNSNLDTAGELALSRTLERAKEQKITVITITQRPALLQTVDKILVLVNGTVVLFGMRQDVLQALAQRGMSMDGGPFSNIQIK